MIEIGKILTTHGLDGAVKLQSFCENPEDIFNYNLFIFNNQPISCKKVGLTSKKLQLTRQKNTEIQYYLLKKMI